MAHHADVSGRGQTCGAVVQQHAGEICGRIGTAGRRAVGDSHVAALQQRIIQQTRAIQRLLGRPGRQQRHPAHAANGLARVMRRQGEIIHRATEAGL